MRTDHLHHVIACADRNALEAVHARGEVDPLEAMPHAKVGLHLPGAQLILLGNDLLRSVKGRLPGSVIISTALATDHVERKAVKRGRAAGDVTGVRLGGARERSLDDRCNIAVQEALLVEGRRKRGRPRALRHPELLHLHQGDDGGDDGRQQQGDG